MIDYSIYGMLGPVPKRYNKLHMLYKAFGRDCPIPTTRVDIWSERNREFRIHTEIPEWYVRGIYDCAPSELASMLRRSERIRVARFYVDGEPYNHTGVNTVSMVAEVTPQVRERLDATLAREGMTFGAWVTRMLSK